MIDTATYGSSTGRRAPAMTGWASGWQQAQQGRAQLKEKLADDAWMAAQWMAMHEEWLRVLRASRSGSGHTERNYRVATRQWQEFVASLRHSAGPKAGRPVALWEVDNNHVRQWQTALEAGGAGAATVNLKLSALSSFYSFVIEERRVVAGMELCLFADAYGSPRANPFRHGNLRRPQVAEQSERALPLPPADLGKLFAYLQSKRHTLNGARNYALILAYSETGFRSAEVVRMQWKHIRPSRSQRGRMIYAWAGKGGKAEDEPLPESVWQAIVHYLTLDGRWRPEAPLHEQPLAPDDYIFRGITQRGTLNLRHVTHAEAGQPLSGKSALRIFRTALEKAGVVHAGRYRLHDLRHTWALRMLAGGAHESEIQQRAHHSSLDTTARYLSGLRAKGRDRADVRSQQLAAQLNTFAADEAPTSWEELLQTGGGR